MPEDDGLFEWPRWLGPAIKRLFQVSAVLVLVGCALVATLLAVGAVMNAIAPRRDTTVAAVGVVLVVLATVGFIVSRMARRS
jgi:Zn-dependent alcohol dehydrogenase